MITNFQLTQEEVKTVLQNSVRASFAVCLKTCS